MTQRQHHIVLITSIDKMVKSFKVLESDLHAVNIQLKDLNNKLEDKKSSDTAYSPRYSSIGSPSNGNNNGSPGINTPITIQR